MNDLPSLAFAIEHGLHVRVTHEYIMRYAYEHADLMAAEKARIDKKLTAEVLAAALEVTDD